MVPGQQNPLSHTAFEAGCLKQEQCIQSQEGCAISSADLLRITRSSIWGRSRTLSSLSSLLLLEAGLTRFLDVGALLVHGGAQGGRADVQHADLVHAVVEHPQRVLLVLLVVAEDLAVDEGGEHLGLQEARQEGQVGLRLVGQEGCLEGPPEPESV